MGVGEEKAGMYNSRTTEQDRNSASSACWLGIRRIPWRAQHFCKKEYVHTQRWFVLVFLFSLYTLLYISLPFPCVIQYVFFSILAPCLVFVVSLKQVLLSCLWYVFYDPCRLGTDLMGYLRFRYDSSGYMSKYMSGSRSGSALLVGGLEHLLFSHILGIIIPTD